MAELTDERTPHKGQWDAGAEDEFGLVWSCDVDCPHPEHDDDPAEFSARTDREGFPCPTCGHRLSAYDWCPSCLAHQPPLSASREATNGC